MFAVGDKVVCVNDTPTPEWELYMRSMGYPYPMPKRGSVYVIEDLIAIKNVLGVKVHGIDAIKTHDSGDRYHSSNRFRKIQPCEPEFIELLNRIKPKVSA